MTEREGMTVREFTVDLRIVIPADAGIQSSRVGVDFLGGLLLFKSNE